KENIELLDIAGNEFDMGEVLKGNLSPVFFASALTNFGIEPFLKSFLELTSPPLPRATSEGEEIDVFSDDFSAFVFKIQANMNPQHRDRIAFIRICSGKFKKGMEVYHYQGKNKIKLSQPQQFLAQDREVVEEAYAGDIIGVFDPGIYAIGDTLTEPKNKFKFEGIPAFAPEHFARVRPMDTIKRKQFVKGITQVAQEGAIQVYKEHHIGMEEIIVGVVGTLQMDVLEFRLKNEYGVDIKIDHLPYRFVRWIETEDVDLDNIDITSDTRLVTDLRGRNILLFQNEWGISWVLNHNDNLTLTDVGKVD
ncbi:MAG: peptide chain release factor 3, partial [Clostridia bacterium]|nr:peptide chain release factor 3 [Clostridia bacterium]